MTAPNFRRITRSDNNLIIKRTEIQKQVQGPPVTIISRNTYSVGSQTFSELRATSKHPNYSISIYTTAMSASTATTPLPQTEKTCTTCNTAFADKETKREHMKEDWQ
jgi:hypothetical protein